MPIPKPSASETQNDYVGRCMSEISGEYPQDQAVAICISTYQRGEMSKQKFSDPQKRVQSKLNFDRKWEGINLTNLGENSSACWDNYIQVGTKIVDGREVPDCRGPIEEAEMIRLAEYPFDQCVLEQTDRYGSEEIAKKVCGAIKRDYGK